MSAAQAVPLRFQLGARTLLSVPRRLVRVGLSLEDALEGRVPALPALGAGDHGYLLTSVPASRIGAARAAAPNCALHVRQSYMRYWADLSQPYEAWLAGLSGNARAALRKKRKRFAEADGGAVDLREYRTPAELAEFHALARGVSALTYQERLLDAGLPEDDAFRAEMAARGAAGTVQAWLLFLKERPVAYLYCPAEGRTLIYDRLGHDPELAELSPGTVLQAEAFARVMGAGNFDRFDFTEGEGQHKRQFASGAVACADLLLLRRQAGNRVAMAALGGFDRAMAGAKQLADRPVLRPLTRVLRRG